MVGQPSHVKQLPLNHVCKIGLKFLRPWVVGICQKVKVRYKVFHITYHKMCYGGRVEMGYTKVCRGLSLLSHEGDRKHLSIQQIQFVCRYAGPQYACMEWETRWHAPLHADRRKKRLMEGNGKCRHLKKLTCTGTLQQVLICLRTTPPPPHTHTVYLYTVYLFTQRKGEGESWTREKVRVATVLKAGSKIPP